MKRLLFITLMFVAAGAGESLIFAQTNYSQFKHDNPNHSRLPCLLCHRRTDNSSQPKLPGKNAHAPCTGCHQQSLPIRAVRSRFMRTSEQAAAFRVGFSHANHDASEKLSCAECHRVRPGLPRGRQVSSPVALNHRAAARSTSCATCHNSERAFGGDDFSVCTRCHKGSTWRF